MTLQRGTQIAYVPVHANNDLTHPDVEFGFVWRVTGTGDAFCRYWRKGHIGDLRTRSCSELTPRGCIVEHNTVEQSTVNWWLGVLEKELRFEAWDL